MLYVLSKEIYTKPNLMRNIQTVKRYVDNGSNTFGSRTEDLARTEDLTV